MTRQDAHNRAMAFLEWFKGTSPGLDEFQKQLGEEFYRIFSEEREASDGLLGDMQKDSYAYMSGLRDALLAVQRKAILDGQAHAHAVLEELSAVARELETSIDATIIVRDGITIHALNLEATIDEQSCGETLLDGVPIVHRGLSLEAVPGNRPEVNVKFCLNRLSSKRNP